MSNGLTPAQEAWLRTRQMTEIFSAFTAHDIATMSMDEFARLSGRDLTGQVATEVYEGNSEPPGRPRQAQDDPGQHQGTDFSQLSMSEYAAVRTRYIRPSSGTGRGIFDAS